MQRYFLLIPSFLFYLCFAAFCFFLQALPLLLFLSRYMSRYFSILIAYVLVLCLSSLHTMLNSFKCPINWWGVSHLLNFWILFSGLPSSKAVCFLELYLLMKSCSYSASLQLKPNQTHKRDRRENSIRLNRDIDCWRKRNHREKDQEWGRKKKTESTLWSTNRGNNNRLRQLKDKNELWNRGLIGMKMRWHKWDREEERWYAVPWQHKGCHTCSFVNSSAIFPVEPRLSYSAPYACPIYLWFSHASVAGFII